MDSFSEFFSSCDSEFARFTRDPLVSERRVSCNDWVLTVPSQTLFVFALMLHCKPVSLDLGNESGCDMDG